MQAYRCRSCDKVFNPEKNEICPACGAAVAPSVLTRIERKQTAVRLRAEGMTHYDDHCHDDDAWKDSYGSESHRSAVRAHEATLRAGYAAHKFNDVTTPGSDPAPSSRGDGKRKSLKEVLRDKPGLLALIFLLPLAIRIVVRVVSAILELLSQITNGFGSLGSLFP